MDREKVIKGWECHMEADTLKCADCPYREGWRTCNYADTLYKDVYDLLKEQEAVVRCKDCKNVDYGTDEDGNRFMKCIGSVKCYGGTTPDFFCADGERKEGR